ncbi:hypothetical protein TNCV_1391151 [Trichonephila clavipes]|nr:hypothetical protein TNCV_1391151 [Trichonephila clavipes]
MSATAYFAHPSIRDHWAMRCMSRCPDQVVSLKPDPQCLSAQESLVLIYRPTAVGMKGFVPSQPHSGLLQPKVVLHVPVLSREYILEKTLLNKSGRKALSYFATVMPMRKRGSLGRKTVMSKAVEHTRAAEVSDEKRARLQADQVRHSLARAAETPEQYQVRFQSQQVRQNASRAAETPEQRQSCLQEDQVRHRVARAAETLIQHVVRHLGLRK